jgi:septum formation protein
LAQAIRIIVSEAKLHLASSSPRRREILASLGLRFSWAATDTDESPHAGEAAESLVVRLAVAKANAARTMPGSVIVGADTEVVVDSEVLGKPADADNAVRMLLQLSGRSHRVLSGVAVRSGDRVQTALSSTIIRFRVIPPAEARAYCATGEYAGKAGAYAIQGLGGVFALSLDGSYSGVVGLPVFETSELLKAAGVDIWDATTFAGPAG